MNARTRNFTRYINDLDHRKKLNDLAIKYEELNDEILSF